MLKDRIKMARERAGLTQQELADKVGVSQTTIMYLENGRNKSSSKIVDIANALKVDSRWLANGVESNGELIDGALSPWSDGDPVTEDDVDIPFLKEVCLSAGHGNVELNDYEGRKLRFSRKTLKDHGVNPEQAVCVTIQGDSMEPILRDNGTVGVDMGNTALKDGAIYAINNEGLLQVKRIKRVSANEISIESYNPEYAPVIKKLSDIQIIGYVFWYSILF